MTPNLPPLNRRFCCVAWRKRQPYIQVLRVCELKKVVFRVCDDRTGEIFRSRDVRLSRDPASAIEWEFYMEAFKTAGPFRDWSHPQNAVDMAARVVRLCRLARKLRRKGLLFLPTTPAKSARGRQMPLDTEQAAP